MPLDIQAVQGIPDGKGERHRHSKPQEEHENHNLNTLYPLHVTPPRGANPLLVAADAISKSLQKALLVSAHRPLLLVLPERPQLTRCPDF